MRTHITIKEFLSIPLLEDVHSEQLYEVRARLEHLGKILVLWNTRKLECKDAMNKIWMVFREAREEAWRKQCETLKKTKKMKP